jgi:hypothetical protein
MNNPMKNIYVKMTDEKRMHPNKNFAKKLRRMYETSIFLWPFGKNPCTAWTIPKSA